MGPGSNPLLAHNAEWAKTPKLTGGSSAYYVAKVSRPSTEGREPYDAECNDIIEALKMTFAEGNVFKAVWRIASARLGNGKAGTSALYDSEKIEYFGGRMVKQYTPYEHTTITKHPRDTVV